MVLAGGSAFGLAACDGVVAWLEANNRGFPTAGGRVPIVVGMVLFDLTVGDGSVRPDAAAGYTAAGAAAAGDVPLGRVGAGRGLTYGKWRGRDHARPGGLGAASERDGNVVVSALVAVNALGDLRDGQTPAPSLLPLPVDSEAGLGNTTVGVVVTNAQLDKTSCHLGAQSAHDGLARALDPAHSASDGDAFVFTATGAVSASLARVRVLAARAVERVIRDAVAR